MAEKADKIINTIIGANTDVWGTVAAGGWTRVDGSVRGDVSAAGRIVVGERGRMKSDLDGTAITIGGVVRGDVIASERVVVLSTGLVLGDVITRRIQADEGCVIHGRIMVCTTDEAWDAAVAAHRDAAGVKKTLAGKARRVV
jgi:cytoskeletal protein CcmA (bactofilin family)